MYNKKVISGLDSPCFFSYNLTNMLEMHIKTYPGYQSLIKITQGNQNPSFILHITVNTKTKDKLSNANSKLLSQREVLSMY